MSAGTLLTFALLSALPVGTTRFEGSITNAAAKKQVAAKECRRPAKAAPKDKFAEVDRNLTAGSCWVLEWLAKAKAAQRPPEMEKLRRVEVIPTELLPPSAEGDKLAVTLRKDEIRIEALTRESGFASGRQVTLTPIAAGDFSGGGAAELLLRRSYSSIGATYDECEVVLMALKKKKYVIVKRKALGRCG